MMALQMAKTPQMARGMVGVIFVVLLALTLGVVGRSDQVLAEEVPTSGTLGGGAGATLNIECKWELPDMTPNDLAMTYGTPVPDDDNPALDATSPACDPPANAANFRRHMMQMTPNPDDLPIKRQYEKWVAIHSTNIGDIVDVFFKVWEPYVASPPNGPNCASPVTFAGDPTPSTTNKYCFKYQHHATGNLAPPTTANPLIKVACGATGLQGAALTAMFTAAINTGQMTAAEQTTIIDKCFQNEKAIYRVQEEISKEQPCGEYRVEVTAVNSAGAPFTNVNYFDVICTVVLQRDFTTVAWGTILNNQNTVVSGDTVFGGAAPTLRNVGNNPMYVEVHYNPLVLSSDPTKTITRFDVSVRAAWQTDPSTITHVDPILASQWHCFDQHPIGSNQNAKIDFSVHPENAQQGSYTGSVDIVVRQDCAAPHNISLHTAGHP